MGNVLELKETKVELNFKILDKREQTHCTIFVYKGAHIVRTLLCSTNQRLFFKLSTLKFLATGKNKVSTCQKHAPQSNVHCMLFVSLH